MKAKPPISKGSKEAKKPLPSCAPIPAPCPIRELSALDGPLSHLLERRHKAELALDRARLEVEQFSMACQVLIDEAAGRLTPGFLPAQVRGYIKEIRNWSVQAHAIRTQRAD